MKMDRQGVKANRPWAIQLSDWRFNGALKCIRIVRARIFYTCTNLFWHSFRANSLAEEMNHA